MIVKRIYGIKSHNKTKFLKVIGDETYYFRSDMTTMLSQKDFDLLIKITPKKYKETVTYLKADKLKAFIVLNEYLTADTLHDMGFKMINATIKGLQNKYKHIKITYLGNNTWQIKKPAM